MTSLEPAAVVAASNAWLWYPDDATVSESADHLLVCWPAWMDLPPTLARFTPDADIHAAYEVVVAQVRAWGETRLTVWVKLDAPAGFEAMLRAMGGVPDEAVDVFALPLADVRDLDVPGDVEVVWRNDVQSVKDGAAVAVAAFEEGALLDDEQAAKHAREYAADHAAGRGGSVVAYVDGRPAGTGGLTLADGVARLWGGATHPDVRGRGAYRAVSPPGSPTREPTARASRWSRAGWRRAARCCAGRGSRRTARSAPTPLTCE